VKSLEMYTVGVWFGPSNPLGGVAKRPA